MSLTAKVPCIGGAKVVSMPPVAPSRIPPSTMTSGAVAVHVGQGRLVAFDGRARPQIASVSPKGLRPSVRRAADHLVAGGPVEIPAGDLVVGAEVGGLPLLDALVLHDRDRMHGTGALAAVARGDADEHDLRDVALGDDPVAVVVVELDDDRGHRDV
jgi:hypothetical protein